MSFTIVLNKIQALSPEQTDTALWSLQIMQPFNVPVINELSP